MTREQPSRHEYTDAIRANTIIVNGTLVGDLVEFHDLANGHRVVLTEAMRPYSNASFATREGAMNYIKLIASTRPAASSSIQCPHCRWGFAPSVIDQHIREKHS